MAISIGQFILLRSPASKSGECEQTGPEAMPGKYRKPPRAIATRGLPSPVSKRHRNEAGNLNDSASNPPAGTF